MVAFARIEKAAIGRVGAKELVDRIKHRIPPVKSAAALRKMPDDRYLSLMGLRIFRAGLKHEMVDAKWPAFEKAFHGFDPRRVRAMSDEAIEALMKDAKLIRHLGKLQAVHANGAAVVALAEEKGSVGAYLADWPGDNIVGLWDDLAKRFSHLGGGSGQQFLRMAGKDTFVLSDWVVKALNHWGVVKGEAKGKADRAKIQEAFNGWAKETGKKLAHLSMTLAASVD
ncbi:MAG TPA: DNA-3-methyladenine glycosylase I [Stellaceae bacterium]